MKTNLFSLFILSLIFSCGKSDKKLDHKYECDKLSGVHKFVYEPIVVSNDCNCIVSGKVKYLKDCKTVALVYYGDGVCDNKATKIICENGNCFDKDDNPIKSFEYDIDCNGNNITEGSVSHDEFEDLNDPFTGPQP